MAEEISHAMNLDLNLGPVPVPPADSISSSPAIWTEEPLHSDNSVGSYRARQRWRSRHPIVLPEVRSHLRAPPESQNLPVELNHFVVRPGIGTALQAGQGSVEAEERTEEVSKACENDNGVTQDEASEKKVDVEKGNGNDGSFFDCNICLDLARDPVVTCCGHLFCWSCIYRWLHLHSEAKECPVCKGEVTYKNVTPIYGRGNNNVQDPEKDPTVKIPLRPHARRVEGIRQTIQRTTLGFTMEEMIRRLGGGIDLTRDLVQDSDPNAMRESAERTSSLLNRFLTSRGIRREHNHGEADDGVGGVDLTTTQNNLAAALDADDNRRLQSLLLRRTQSQRATLSSISSALTSAERVVETYFRSRAVGRNQEQTQAVGDDRDSYSSIAAVINSESQVDTAVEIDSMVSLSTSSSRRRNDASRPSDVDTGDSRAPSAPRPRRRRLN